MSPAHNNLGKHVILRAECNYSQDSDIFRNVVRQIMERMSEELQKIYPCLIT